MVTERGLEVLRAIVHDYVSSREPVGSKAIAERYQFGVSSATIRNDMAALEEEHLIAAPHTSSGRVPTDAGYRLFVDHLAQTRVLSSSSRSGIERFLGESDDFNDLLVRTVRTLAQLTNQVAVVEYPTLGTACVQHVEIVRLSASRIMSVLITDNGRVDQRIVDGEIVAGDNDIAQLGLDINGALAGVPLAEVGARLARLPVQSGEYAKVRTAVCETLREQVNANRQSRLVMAGAANLLRTESDFAGSLYPILDAIEEQVVVLKLLGQMAVDNETVAVSIGSEHAQSGLTQTSVIASGYSVAGAFSQLGLIGPTRMDYSGNIAAVRAVARYLTHLLDGPSGR